MPRNRGGILEEMFSYAQSPADRAACLEAYKERLSKSLAETREGKVWLDRRQDPASGQPYPVLRKAAYAVPARVAEAQALFDTVSKSLTSDQAAAMANDLAQLRGYLQTDLAKDWTPTNPVGSPVGATPGVGLTPYDLEDAAKILVPHDTPMRNSTVRLKGVGNARQFKRITGWTNSGTGGAPTQLPFFSSANTTSTWGSSLTLNRPPKISYTGDSKSVGYVELGFSDSVNYLAQFEALGFADLQALSHTALLWSHLLGEERAMLYARGSGTGYEGAVAAPTLTSPTAVGTSTGGSIGAATYYVNICAWAGGGWSVVSSQFNSGALTGSTNLITITPNITTEPTGAIYYGVFVGTSTSNGTLQTTFLGGTSTITLTAYTTTGTALPTADGTASTLAYDGWLTVQADPTISGYVNRVNAPFSTSTPGAEFDAMFQTMWTNNAADPDQLWMSGALRTELNQLMRVGGTGSGTFGAASGYRTNVETGDNGVVMSTTVTGYVNPATGKVLDIEVHRFMPAGAVLARSLSLPIQDSEIPAPVASVNVLDYMAIDWPDIQMSRDTSTYQVGTLVHYAPAWHGLLLGVH
jgi:hypothetical protein